MAKLKYLEHTDEVLVALTLSGDQDAYEMLVARYERSVLATARCITHDEYLAEDASQEAFVSAWIKLDCLREPARFGSWVRRIAKNCAVNIVTRLREYVSYDVLENAVHAGNCDIAEENEDERGEYIDLLRESIGKLPARVREIITLHYFEGLSVADIAARLGLAQGTVKWQLHDGRERIRKDVGVMEKKVDTTLVERVMKEVEELKLWGLKNDKTGFSEAYEKTLRAVEELPECHEKDHAMADVLMRGFWWLPGQRNDELLARMKEYALKGHNDEVMAGVCAAEREKFWGDRRIQFMRDTQVPFLKEHGFVKALGREWYEIGEAFRDAGNREEMLAAWQKVTDVLPSSDMYVALVEAAKQTEAAYWEKKEALGSDQTFSMRASGTHLRRIEGEWRLWGDHFYYRGSLWNVEGMRNLIFSSACMSESRFFMADARVGDVFEGTDHSTLTFALEHERVETPAGVFENCQMWETEAWDVRCQSWYAEGVGIVRQRLLSQGEWSERLLKAYVITGGEGLLPLAVGNRWEYVGTEDPAYMVAQAVYEVTYTEGDDVILAGNFLHERMRYNEDSWNDTVLQMRSDYIKHDDRWNAEVQDVSHLADRAEALARTPYEVAYSRAACAVMRRIMATSLQTNPHRTASGHWNFFDVACLRSKEGKLSLYRDHRGTRSFEYKDTGGLGDKGRPLLFNHMIGILQDVAGCLWSDEWKDGYEKRLESERYSRQMTTMLRVRHVGRVTTKAGSFDDCLEVSVDASGLGGSGWSYRGGKQEYTFAPGVGLLRAVYHYKQDEQQAVYELASYIGTGEGYMPMTDGMDRRFEAVGLTCGYVAYVNCYVRERADGVLCLMEDRCGIREFPSCDENDFDSIALYLSDRFDYYGRPDEGDVAHLLGRLDALATTPYRLAYARLVRDAVERIQATEESLNPGRTHSGHRNIFDVRYLVERSGRMDHVGREWPLSIWRGNMKGTGDWGAPMFFSNLYGIWSDAVDGFWNSILVPGATATLKHKRHGYDVTTELSCREVGSVTTSVDTFMNCIEVAVEIKGMPYEICFHNGTKKFYFAPGVGMIRTVQDHKDHTLQGIYDLVAYEGKGEGYFPLCEGMTRRYEAQFMREGYIAAVEYVVERDERGNLCLIEDRCGIKKL